MMTGKNVTQQSERCGMTLKNGQRCRYPSKYNGLCGLHWQALMSNRPKLTRRQWLQITANVAQVIGTGILIRDHLRSKPPVTPIARVVADELAVKVTESVRVTIMPESASLHFAAGIPTILVHTAAKTSISPRLPAGVPMDMRRSVWQMRLHPKRLAEVAAGRLRWSQLQFPSP